MNNRMSLKDQRKPRRRIVAAIIAVLTIWAFYPGLALRSYQLRSKKIPNGFVRIVCIADLHSHIYGQNQQPLIQLIDEQKPDIIALLGDIADDKVPDSGMLSLLEGIKDTALIYYVSGNHEYWSDRYDDIKAKIESFGVTVLDNKSEDIIVNGVRMCVSGVDDPLFLEHKEFPDWRTDTKQAALFRRQFFDLDNSVFNVLLAHRPERIHTYLKYDFDLILAGHTHGGQVRIPLLLNGLLAPNQGFFPKYGGGRYDFDGKSMIISRGLSFIRYVPRIFNPPEVVVVDIVSGT